MPQWRATRSCDVPCMWGDEPGPFHVKHPPKRLRHSTPVSAKARTGTPVRGGDTSMVGMVGMVGIMGMVGVIGGISARRERELCGVS